MSKRLRTAYAVAFGLAAMGCISAAILTTGKIQDLVIAWGFVLGVGAFAWGAWSAIEDQR
ncbi:MAG TPA: hypothetical protein VNG12_10805 [Acidimicrobiales bacterium]|nr:hypothetical protein [Acidimicrobiales bacterium]